MKVLKKWEKRLKIWNYLEVGASRCEIDVSESVLSSWRKLGCVEINSTGGGKVVLEFLVSVVPVALLQLLPWLDERPFCLSYFGCISGICNPVSWLTETKLCQAISQAWSCLSLKPLSDLKKDHSICRRWYQKRVLQIGSIYIDITLGSQRELSEENK